MTSWFAKQLARFGVGSAQAEALASTAPSSDPVSILLVDDTPANLGVLVETLGAAGYQLMVAEDGEEALAQTAQTQPDLILLDVMMPGIDGFETCRRIRTESWGERIVIVALTGWGQDADRRRSTEAGFDAHLVKPVDHSAMVELLTNLDALRRPG